MLLCRVKGFTSHRRRSSVHVYMWTPSVYEHILAWQWALKAVFRELGPDFFFSISVSVASWNVQYVFHINPMQWCFCLNTYNKTKLCFCGVIILPGLMLTTCGYVVHWEVVYMRHVANGWEDHKASQDTSEWVGNRHDKSIPGKEGRQNKLFQSSSQETRKTTFLGYQAAIRSSR